MPFIGKTPETGAFRLIDSITTSATDTYALTVQGDHYFPESARNLIVSLNGVTQAPETAYTVSGSHIVFASALTASDVIDYILVIGDAVDIGTPSDGTVGNAQLKASLDLSGKTLTFSNDQISGDAVDGGTISNFASTGIDDNATSTAITIDSSERVGINVPAPTVPLEVNVAGAGDVFRLTRDTGTNGELNIDFSGANTNFNSEQGGFTFETASRTNAVVISSYGNVGINVTPENSNGTWRNFEQGGMNLVGRVSGGVDGMIGTNYVFETDNSEVYKTTNPTSRLFFDANEMLFQQAGSGTAGTSISWSEAMRIDSSGNLLVGKDVANDSTVGARFSNAGFMSLVRDGGRPLFIRRDTTDGDLLEFSRSGTTVGSIGSNAGTRVRLSSQNVAGYLGIGSTDYFAWNTSDFRPQADAAYDLGASGARFRDIHLSGGVNFSANPNASGMTSELLDDYEEGTWTPVLGGASGDPSNLTISVQYGRYTKVGNMVSVQCDFYVSSMTAGSGSIEVKGFPFTSATDNSWSNRWYSLGQPNVEHLASSLTSNSLTALMRSGQSQTFIYKNNLGTSGMNPLVFGTDVTTSFLVRFSFVYPAS